MAHKTFAGMVRAVERLASEMESCPIDNQHDYDAFKARADALLRELNGLWSNPAQGDDAARLKNRLIDAWYGATA
jgi:hypothetical protein